MQPASPEYSVKVGRVQPAPAGCRTSELRLKKAIVLIFIVFYAVFAPVFAANEQCVALSRTISANWGRDVVCQCGSVLANLEATLPDGVRMRAVCDLVSADAGKIDLRKTKVNLDQFSKNGGYVLGEFYLQGELRLKGMVMIEPSYGGDMFFYPRSKVSLKRDSVFMTYFESFKLDSDDNYRKLRTARPKDLTTCSYANAELLLKNFVVNVSDTASSGTSPESIEVLAVSAFKKCSRAK